MRSADCIGSSDRSGVVYQNEGNLLLLSLLSSSVRTVLDVGCGAGDNARVIRTINENIEIVGITLSAEESKLARQHMTAVHVVDLDVSDLSFVGDRRFDAVIFSHVLEHVKDPQRVLNLSARHLRVGGQMLIAVPNVLFASSRVILNTRTAGLWTALTYISSPGIQQIAI